MYIFFSFTFLAFQKKGRYSHTFSAERDCFVRKKEEEEIKLKVLCFNSGIHVTLKGRKTAASTTFPAQGIGEKK